MSLTTRPSSSTTITPAHGLEGLLAIWKAAQILPPKVTRWNRYTSENDQLRKQNNHAHCFSLSVLASIILSRLRPHSKEVHPPLNESLILRSVIFHEEGEALRGRDIIFQEKSALTDLEEYKAFITHYTALPPRDFKECQRAFLLQYARKNPECFPDDARNIMKSLCSKHWYEVLAFEAIETLDYLLYAIECHDDHGDIVVLGSVLSNQPARLTEYAKILPGFRQEVWTPELEAYCLEMAKRCSREE